MNTDNTDNTDTFEIEDHCQRCGHTHISDDGKCQKCGFKCWHNYH